MVESPKLTSDLTFTCRLLHTLRMRYTLDMIYTYSGNILIAVRLQPLCP